MNSPSSCRRRARLPAALSFALTFAALPLVLAGCGNKGPLVLPEEAEPAQAVATPAAAPAPIEPATDAARDAAPGQAPPTEAPPADTPEPPPAHD